MKNENLLFRIPFMQISSWLLIFSSTAFLVAGMQSSPRGSPDSRRVAHFNPNSIGLLWNRKFCMTADDQDRRNDYCLFYILFTIFHPSLWGNIFLILYRDKPAVVNYLVFCMVSIKPIYHQPHPVLWIAALSSTVYAFCLQRLYIFLVLIHHRIPGVL